MVKDQQNSFACVPRSVIEKIPEIGAYALVVYLILADHANEAFECWPSKSRIARLTGMTSRGVRLQLQTLEEAGVIVIKNRVDDSGPLSNLYAILNPFQPPKSNTAGVVNDVHGVVNMVHGGGERNDPGVVNMVHPNKSKRTRVKEPKGADAVLVPEGLETEAFRKAWSDWTQHRAEIRKKLTPTATKAALKKLAAWGPARAIAAIEHSISQGWTGIYEPSTNGTKPVEKHEAEPIQYRDIHAR